MTPPPPTGWTLGEWHEPESRGRLGYMTVDVPDGYGAIRVYGELEQAEAMAHFIAHAPDVARDTEALLDVLETRESKLRLILAEMVNDLPYWYQTRKPALYAQARAALEGETWVMDDTDDARINELEMWRGPRPAVTR